MNNRVALLCGAGISFDSGLPLANQLKQRILEKLAIDKKGTDRVLEHSGLPFESFMETIAANADISAILDVFESGRPNTNHIFLAKLAKRGLLKTIYTTNFDMHIEAALENEGLRKRRDFQVYWNEKQFEALDLDRMNDGRIRLFKLHGSVEDRESIRITLKAVASRFLSDRRADLVKHLFLTGKHEQVLILGYSCSDEFDIVPQIQRLSGKRKEIVIVDHSKMETIEDVATQRQRNPFQRFNGTRLKCDTNDFIRDLWNSLEEEIGKYVSLRTEGNWQAYVDNWGRVLEENREYLRYLISALLLYGVSDFKGAIEYSGKSLAIAKLLGNASQEAVCYANIGASHDNLGDFQQAIENYEASLKIAKVTRDEAEQSRNYTNLGASRYKLGDFHKAIEDYRESLRIAQGIRDATQEARSYTGLGNAYNALGDFTASMSYHEKALTIYRATGDKLGESWSHTNLGNSYYALGDSGTAIECHQKALEIARAIGDRPQESASYANLGMVYGATGNLKMAIRYYGDSLEMNRETGNRRGESICYNGLGSAYCSLGDLKMAMQCYERALRIAKEVGSREGESSCYTNMGVVVLRLGDHQKAIEYTQRSLEIAKAIGDREAEARCYVNLGSIYSQGRDYVRAIPSFLAAERIFQDIGQVHHLEVVRKNLFLAYRNVGDYRKAAEYRSLATSEW